jgi:tRNA threonylcarbamoyl adenosine modification protein (Sua5/YciO/YrdC/YwlC family)
MAQYFRIHPDNPQARLIKQASRILLDGGIGVYPTDSSYAIGCCIGNKAAMDRIRHIRRIDDKHNFTLVARDLSEIATYARIDDEQYRLIKATTPGPYTFILPATRQVPRRLQNPRRKTIGLRIPDYRITQSLIEELGEPIMSSTLILPDQQLPMSDPEEIRMQLEHEVDVVIDGGFCGVDPTTVVSWVEDQPTVARVGRGDPGPFL